MRIAAVSVDLDEIPNYFAIHGLQPPAGPEANAVYDVALDRLDRFARAHDLPLTLFAIGADMARPAAAQRLRAMAERGHEIANHSLDHLYDLTRRERSEQVRQVESGRIVLEGATGARPSGFRAPGYTMTDELFAVLEELGVVYDSSVFPCPPYYAAKAVAMAGIALRGRRSRSVLDRPVVLAAPTRPYRAGKPYWRRNDAGGVLELPVQVTRGLRLPFIGTTLILAGAARARWLTRWVVGEPLINLELHGIDVLGREDGLEALAPHQPDVRVALADKLAALGAVIEALRDAGYAFVRLDEAAAAFG
jgi:peptidoglycan/xylan/chitin deacetylase (PgdA/CDA1 family)